MTVTTNRVLSMTLTDLIEDYLLLWILLSGGLGIALPRLAVVTRASTLILAVMIGSISLTLSVEQFRGIDPRTLGLVLAAGLPTIVSHSHSVWPRSGLDTARIPCRPPRHHTPTGSAHTGSRKNPVSWRGILDH